MNLELIVSLLTSITSLVAIYIAIYTIRRENKRASVQIMLETGEKFFESPEWIQKRLIVADLMNLMQDKFIELRENKNNDQKSDELIYKEIANEIVHYPKDTVLNYFESFAYLIQFKTLRIDYFASYYSYWVHHYWTFFKYCIESDRETDKGCWSNLETIYCKMIKHKSFKQREISLNYKEFIEYELLYSKRIVNNESAR